MKFYLFALLFLLTLTGCDNSASSIPAASIPPPVTQEPYDKLTEALLTKRLKIEVVREEGGKNGCEPQEPYYRLSVKRRGAESYLKDPEAEDGGKIDTREILEDTDIASGIVMIESTGEIEVMDKCLE